MKKFLILFVVIILAIAIVIGWAFKIVFFSQKGNGQIKDFIVKEGEGVNQISQDLKSEELIDNSFIFETWVWLKGSENKIQAGDHKIKDTWSISQITNALISGNTIENETNITIIEGWNLWEIADYLEKQNIAQLDDFLSLVGYPAIDYDRNPDLPRPEDFSGDYPFLASKPRNLSLEGYLFPDTYRIFKNSKVETIVRKMLDNFGQKVTPEMMTEIKKQGKTLHEILTLASIIEKEANTLENKKRVAGVYYNRLDKGIALQADPTVNYITGKKTDRPTYEDLENDNPYNTYLYPGLPPGPITNPGLDSIMAAIYPENNDYYYFINTPDGDMVFAKTFEEHKQNRLKYFNN